MTLPIEHVLAIILLILGTIFHTAGALEYGIARKDRRQHILGALWAFTVALGLLTRSGFAQFVGAMVYAAHLHTVWAEESK